MNSITSDICTIIDEIVTTILKHKKITGGSMLKKIIIAINLATILAIAAPSFAAVVVVRPHQWQDWRWRESHRAQWEYWHRYHQREWRAWGRYHPYHHKRWCYYHPYSC
jgi:hypothetical protein